MEQGDKRKADHGQESSPKRRCLEDDCKAASQGRWEGKRVKSQGRLPYLHASLELTRSPDLEIKWEGSKFVVRDRNVPEFQASGDLDVFRTEKAFVNKYGVALIEGQCCNLPCKETVGLASMLAETPPCHAAQVWTTDQ